MPKVVWVIGASSGLGRAVVVKHASAGDSIILTSGNSRDLENIAADMRIRYNVKCFILQLDLNTVTDHTLAQNITDGFGEDMPSPDLCYVLSGRVDTADAGFNAAEILPNILQVNFTSVALLISAYLNSRTGKKSELIVASSIAASRARTKNLAYSTSKLALEQYCSGLMHALPESAASIRIYRFGYMDTKMSYGQKLLFKPKPPEVIAGSLYRHCGKPSGLYYLPGFWRLVIFALNLLPLNIYRKLKF